MALTEKLTAIADAIRGKTGKTDGLTLDQMATEIAGIQGGNGSENAGSTFFQTADVVVDNTSTTVLRVPLDDDTLDNYAVDYTCIETGVYTDGALSLDDVPTFPANMNLPMHGISVYLKNPLTFNGYAGTTMQDGDCLSSAHAVMRGAKSTYARTKFEEGIENGNMVIRSQYNFGKVDYYFKFRVNIYGWNSPEVAQ